MGSRHSLSHRLHHHRHRKGHRTRAPADRQGSVVSPANDPDLRACPVFCPPAALLLLVLRPRSPSLIRRVWLLSGGFSETYAALCDYNGIGCKEEVQWVRGSLLLINRAEGQPGLCLRNCPTSRWSPSLCSSVSLCPRMWTPSTTLRTTGSSTYWISAILTAGDSV